jgi:hypothetical protein
MDAGLRQCSRHTRTRQGPSRRKTSGGLGDVFAAARLALHGEYISFFLFPSSSAQPGLRKSAEDKNLSFLPPLMRSCLPLRHFPSLHYSFSSSASPCILIRQSTVFALDPSTFILAQCSPLCVSHTLAPTPALITRNRQIEYIQK